MAQAGANLCSISSMQRGGHPLFEISGNLRRENVSLFGPGTGFPDLLCFLLVLIRPLIWRIGGLGGNALLPLYFQILCNLRLNVLHDCSVIRAFRTGTRSDESRN